MQQNIVRAVCSSKQYSERALFLRLLTNTKRAQQCLLLIMRCRRRLFVRQPILVFSCSPEKTPYTLSRSPVCGMCCGSVRFLDNPSNPCPAPQSRSTCPPAISLRPSDIGCVACCVLCVVYGSSGSWCEVCRGRGGLESDLMRVSKRTETSLLLRLFQENATLLTPGDPRNTYEWWNERRMLPAVTSWTTKNVRDLW